MTDPSRSTPNDKPKPERSIFEDLLSTSHAIKRALSPVDIRPSFLGKLRNELHENVEHARASVIMQRRRREKIRWTAIGAGITVYALGISVVLLRLLRWCLTRFRDSGPHRPANRLE